MSDNQKNHQFITFNISTAAILKLLLFGLLILFLYLVRQVVALVFAALIFAMALDPWVDWLQKHKIPRSLGVTLIYVLAIALFSLSIVLLIPPVTQQVNDLAANFPDYYQQISSTLGEINFLQGVDIQKELSARVTELGKMAGSTATTVVNAIFSLFKGVLSLFLMLVLTFYFIITEAGLKKMINMLTPKAHQPYVIGLFERMQLRMGLWLKGQLILSLVIFVLAFVGLTVVGVKYALLLAFLAGLFEVIPFVGPVAAAVPGIFLALHQSPMTALLALIVYMLIQQLEGHFIVPKVMSKTVDMNPLVVIIVVLIGVELGGIIGAILAIPVATAVSIALKDVIENREKQRNAV
ncbi:MAG: AI-2E family transporter [bacterium]|nr:AI-2E family transporter [bacterium]